MIHGPIDDSFSHLLQVSSYSLYTPAYTSPVESPLVIHNMIAGLDGHFPISASPLPAKSLDTHLVTADPLEVNPVHVPGEQEAAPAATNAFGENNYLGLTTLDAHTTLQTPTRSSSAEDTIPLASVVEDAVDAPSAPPTAVASRRQAPGPHRCVLMVSPFPAAGITPTTPPTGDSPTTKTDEAKSRPRNIQKDSFAARHRIQVETPSIPTSGSSSLVHRTRRGRPSVGPVGDQMSTKSPGAPPGAPPPALVDPRPAARRARQRKRNSSGDESYSGSDKKFKCEYCGQTFGRKEHVKRHMNGIHQQIKGKTLLYPIFAF